ncbi:Ribbon-helix-helix protein, copG family [Prosthecobacter debontii]|uniref:Ribbon-helix-helix protein, copG family n=1 Tax=Prosthecobacter debontii TaxID=48467 RepID=A0A1T4X6R1_9BACT|nr:ribbon-helix-helix protein, CopG family [Prosthecobacter debontii]SKA84788.1 Ribbon-helix-helix protein, copG family [Prosthecobacter debontii]
MANQRKKGIERVTLTLPDELLREIEAEAEELGVDRLALMRTILANRKASPRPTSKKRGAKAE